MRSGWIVCHRDEGAFSYTNIMPGDEPVNRGGSTVEPAADGVRVNGVALRAGLAARVGGTMWSCMDARFGQGGVREVRLGRMVAASDSMIEAMHSVAAAGLSPSPVLILGESGTGKELAADYLGQVSGAMYAVNMGAVPAELAEAELFGWVRGAFTGAVDSRAGALESAGSGVLFLDELAEAPAWVQVKLLRALDCRKFRRLGASRDIPLQARVVAATNMDPIEGVASGQLRLDLLERLACHVVRLPPLRSRPADLQCLVRSFASSSGDGLRESAPPPSPEVMDLLRRWPWPGNVRELRNVVSRVMLSSLSGLSDVDLVRDSLEQGRVLRPSEGRERECAGSTRAGEIASSGLPRSTFYYRLKRGRIPSDRGPRRAVTSVVQKT